MRLDHHISKKLVLAGSLACLLAVATPQTAHAQGIPTIDIQGVLAQAMNAFLKSFGDNFQAALGINNTQAILDAADRNALTQSQLAEVAKYQIPANNGACAVTEGEAAGAGVGGGAKSLGDSLAGGGQQTSGVTPSQRLSQACGDGNINSTEYPDLAKAVGNCTVDPDTSVVNDRHDADINYASVSNDDMMEMPSGIIFTGSVMVMPTSGVNSLPKHQKSFIDAYNMCVNKNGVRPPNMAASGNSTVTTAVLGSYEQRMETLARSPSFKTCTDEIARNTAVSSKNSSDYGKNFTVQFTLEEDECDSMTALGMTDPVITACKTSGISPAKIEKLKAARFTPTYLNNLVQSRNLTPDEVTMVVEQHTDYELMINAIRDIADAVKVNAANTQPKNGEPARTGLDQPVK